MALQRARAKRFNFITFCIGIRQVKYVRKLFYFVFYLTILQQMNYIINEISIKIFFLPCVSEFFLIFLKKYKFLKVYIKDVLLQNCVIKLFY